MIIPSTETDVIIIPQSATFEIQDKIFVYKVVDGKAIATEIKTAKRNDGNNYIVSEGLAVGDKIVSEGVGVIKDGSAISIKE